MSIDIDSDKKGLELEKLIATLFKTNGYDTQHNVNLTGSSGVQHQIDVYAEYKAPLHTSRVIIECKSHNNPINKDAVIKLNHEEDLRVDRGILVTTSYFTPDAISTARNSRVDLWDSTKLKELLKYIPDDTPIKEINSSNVFYFEPVKPVEYAIEAVENTLFKVKGLFRKNKKK